MLKKWCSENTINMMEWPAQFPDLNLIENLWTNDIKTCTHAIKKEMVLKTFEKPCSKFRITSQLKDVNIWSIRFEDVAQL